MPVTALTARSPHPAMALMAAETRVFEGEVGRSLNGVAVAEGSWGVSGETFLLRGEGGIGLRYDRGRGITLERPAGADPREIALWLNGTVYAAVAALNGLVPLHASAVAHRGRVYAFTGPSGSGKSTLVAALGAAGLAQFCDDTLILDPAGDGPPLALPGHKQLKLWPEGARLAAVEPGELVSGGYLKHYVAPVAGCASEPLPLAELIVLDVAHEPTFHPLAGGERIAALDDDHYTGELWRSSGRGRAARFATLAALARRFKVTRFARPFDPARFEEGLAAAARYVQDERQ